MSSRWGWWGCSTGKGVAGGGEKACGEAGGESLPSAAAAGHKERRGRGPFPLRAPLPSRSGGEALLEMLLLIRSPAEGEGRLREQKRALRAPRGSLLAATSGAGRESSPASRELCGPVNIRERLWGAVEFWFCPRLAFRS